MADKVRQALKTMFGDEKAQRFDDKDVQILVDAEFQTVDDLRDAVSIGQLPTELSKARRINILAYFKEEADRAAANTARVTLELTKRNMEIPRTRCISQPTWEKVCAAVEKEFPEFEVEEYKLFILEKGEVTRDNWRELFENESRIALQVSTLSQDFHSFNEDAFYTIFAISKSGLFEDAKVFPLAEYKEDMQLEPRLATALGINTYGELMTLVGKELALRAFLSNPLGEIEVAAEYSASGTFGHGSIDYVLMFYFFTIVVVEENLHLCRGLWIQGKLHEQLLQHIGQLAAEMQTCRQQFLRMKLGKRKHEDDEEFKKVPSIGILSSGSQYIFWKYDCDKGTVTRSPAMPMQLAPGVTADEAAKQALPIIRRMLNLIHDQKAIMRSVALPPSVKKWSVGPEPLTL